MNRHNLPLILFPIVVVALLVLILVVLFADGQPAQAALGIL